LHVGDFGLLKAADGSFELACPPYLEASAYLGNAGCDIYPLIGAIACPVTVLRARTGERTSAMDFSISPTWPELARQFRNGHDLQWSELSHFIPMEAPARLAGLIIELVARQQG
jgi:pimeloyl-ACP methyl ester carboxylesterase